jgi:hypothetical protein
VQREVLVIGSLIRHLLLAIDLGTFENALDILVFGVEHL